MHESRVIRRLLDVALAAAKAQGATLVGIDVRLGVLAGGSPSHLREHFEIELSQLGLAGIALRIVDAPDHPGGVEITGLELRR